MSEENTVTRIETPQIPFIYQLISAEEEVIEEYNDLNRSINDIAIKREKINIKNNEHRGIIPYLGMAFIFSLVAQGTVNLPFLIILPLLIVAIVYFNKRRKKKFEENMALLNEQLEESQDNEVRMANTIGQQLAENEIYTNQIPEMFRNTQAIAELYAIMQTNQADNLKEAYNLLEARYRHNEVVGVLKDNNALISANNGLLQQQLRQMAIQDEVQRAQLSATRDISEQTRIIREKSEKLDARMAGVEETIVPNSRRRS